MTWLALAGFLLKVVGQILDLHAQGTLTQDKKDSIIDALHQVQ